jgi:hypothetical protein
LNASAVAPVTAALAPLAPTGQAGLGASTGGVIGSAVSRLAARPANAYGAGTARGARPG